MHTEKIKVLSLFCGAVGGWDVGLKRTGHYRTVAACEIDPWRRAVFQAEHPEAIIYDDVRELTAARLLADLGYLPDVVVGSPPCQDISAANSAGEGITDDHLFWEFVRLVAEVRPRWCAAENSPRARLLGIDGIIDALGQAGYACWPCVVGADHAGANHRRRRLWLVAADAERLELWQQPRRISGARRAACQAIAREHDPNADRFGRQGFARADEGRWQSEAQSRTDDPDTDGWQPGDARRHTTGCVRMGATAGQRDVGDPTREPRIRRSGILAGGGADPARAGLSPHPPHAAGAGRKVRPGRTRDHVPELPPALRDIGLAWPDWNGGLAGLAEACAAAGFGCLDDGPGRVLAANARNRAIAGLGDAVVPQIPEAIARAMMALVRGNGGHDDD